MHCPDYWCRRSGDPCDRDIMHKGCRKTKNDFVRKEIVIIFVCIHIITDITFIYLKTGQSLAVISGL